MKIALIGYGKMGMAIEEIAVQKKHSIVLKISIDNLEDNSISNIRKADVAIEFTGPESAFENIKKCIDAGVPVVCGSTGWLNRFQEIKNYCLEKKGALLYASNFSIGVNLFFTINKKLAELMLPFDEYDVSIREIHHTQKKDAPSGTAITIADQILEKSNKKTRWQNEETKDPRVLTIISERIGPTPGTHIVTYHSMIDDIEIRHTAHNRSGFAHGALLAAAFIQGKKGVFAMEDVLGL